MIPQLSQALGKQTLHRHSATHRYRSALLQTQKQRKMSTRKKQPEPPKPVQHTRYLVQVRILAWPFFSQNRCEWGLDAGVLRSSGGTVVPLQSIQLVKQYRVYLVLKGPDDEELRCGQVVKMAAAREGREIILETAKPGPTGVNLPPHASSFPSLPHHGRKKPRGRNPTFGLHYFTTVADTYPVALLLALCRPGR